MCKIFDDCRQQTKIYKDILRRRVCFVYYIFCQKTLVNRNQCSLVSRHFSHNTTDGGANKQMGETLQGQIPK